ncbi:MAG TPA: YciI family protein [Steroidobacteraceae bacterium]|jgi:hypothetical protein
MPYMLLIVESRGQRGLRSPEQGRNAYQRMLDYNGMLRSKGVLIESNSLRADAVRLSVRGGKAVTTDGPFAEAKEMVGGFFLLNCSSREQAVAYARECPAAEWASIEVRDTGPCYE